MEIWHEVSRIDQSEPGLCDVVTVKRQISTVISAREGETVAITEKTKKHLPKAKAQERIKAKEEAALKAEEEAKAAAEAAKAEAEKPAEEPAAEEQPQAEAAPEAEAVAEDASATLPP